MYFVMAMSTVLQASRAKIEARSRSDKGEANTNF